MGISELIRSLFKKRPGSNFQIAERLVADKDFATIRTLLTEAETTPVDLQSRSFIEHVCRTLALSPDLEAINVAVNYRINAGDIAKVYELASWLAAVHDPDLLDRVVSEHCKDHRCLDFLAALIQERIIRGEDLRNHADIGNVWCSVAQSGNQLALLPLYRLDMESTVLLPTYGPRNTNYSMPYGPGLVERAKVSDRVETCQTAEPSFVLRPSADALPPSVSSATQGWVEHSNGRVEAKLFDVDLASLQHASALALNRGEQLIETPWSDFHKPLRELELDSFKGTKSNDFIKDVRSSDVFSLLFSAASTGGAYGGAVFGAHGRLRAWTTISAMVGVHLSQPLPASAPSSTQGSTIESLCETASQCAWAFAELETDWFCQVAWDFCILCLRRDRRQLAVYCATDED